MALILRERTYPKLPLIEQKHSGEEALQKKQWKLQIIALAKWVISTKILVLY